MSLQSSLLAVCLFGSTQLVPLASASDFEALVEGVSEVGIGWTSGPVYPEGDDWVPVVGGDEDSQIPSVVAMAREFGAGRVVAGAGVYGGGNIEEYDEFDNHRLDENLLLWMTSGNGTDIAYTTGHGEWNNAAINLAAVADSIGINMNPLPAPITLDSLQPFNALVVSIAWGPISQDEIDAIETWVKGGGSLLMIGLGWSWVSYHPDQTMEDFPMMQLGSRFGSRWLDGYIYDPTDQHDTGMLLHTFYPDLDSISTADALTRIIQAHKSLGSDLPEILETSDVARNRFVHSHAYMAIPCMNLPINHPDRQLAFNGYTSLVEMWPDYYARGFSFDQSQLPTSAWVRERAWVSWRHSLELTPERVAKISDIGNLEGTRLSLFEKHGLMLNENDRMDEPQMQLIHDVMDLIPTGLLELNGMSAVDYLGAQPTTLTLQGPRDGTGVNVFSWDVGEYVENPFPDDVEAYPGDGFMAVVSHEVNHVVDAMAHHNIADYSNRLAQLIADAGKDTMNYLRSWDGGDGFFFNAPQEFFASIANQWFAKSARTIELGLVRFDAGRLDPINQALFFLDVYSQGTSISWFYTSDGTGLVYREPVLLSRDADGRLIGLDHNGTKYSFTLDTDDNVTSYETESGVIGACCVAGICSPVHESTCLSADGTYLGDNTPCSDNCTPCPDIDGNGEVGVDEVLAVIAAWDTDNADADVNDDGIVDTNDLLFVLSSWGPCP
jgi:hypothetical protein